MHTQQIPSLHSHTRRHTRTHTRAQCMSVGSTASASPPVESCLTAPHGQSATAERTDTAPRQSGSPCRPARRCHSRPLRLTRISQRGPAAGQGRESHHDAHTDTRTHKQMDRQPIPLLKGTSSSSPEDHNTRGEICLTFNRARSIPEWSPPAIARLPGLCWSAVPTLGLERTLLLILRRPRNEPRGTLVRGRDE